jgi:hypothetical protein
VPIGIQDLFAEAQIFPLQQNIDNSDGRVSVGSRVAMTIEISMVTIGDTIPMDLDTFEVEFNALYKRLKSGLKKINTSIMVKKEIIELNLMYIN